MSKNWNERIPPEFLGTSKSTGPFAGGLALSINLKELADTVLDLASTYTPCEFRLIDCNAFVEQHKLCVYEFAEFPNVPYAALSYPWRGNGANDHDDRNSPSYWEDSLGTFAVRGAEDGDPISLDVLLHASTVALMNSRYIWLDRLCIIQTSKDDKVWQIARMYLIYASCEMCCILPGGIRRLVSLEEETSWIHRGWTLQEAVVPKRAIVIFSWKLGFGSPEEPFSFGGTSPFLPAEVIPGKSAWADLRNIVQAAPMTVGIGKKSYRVTVNLFSHEVSRAALIGVLHTMGTDDKDLRLQAVWRSALLRTSSRPVDMIFSIMSIFDVSLDPHAFDTNDRLGATIALAREILKKGGKAHWIGAAYQLDPSPYLSTFPQFPETSVEGKAYAKHPDGSLEPITDVMQSRVHMDCWLTDIPEGSMDENGYLTFEVHAWPVSLVERNSMTPSLERARAMPPNPRVEGMKGKVLKVVTTLDGSIWQVHKGIPPGGAHAYVVYIGKEEQYSTAAFARRATLTPLRGLLVEEHAPGKFHKTSHLEILKEFEDDMKIYRKITFTVGGPNLPPKGTHHL